MSFARWLSFGVGLLGALLTGALLWYAQPADVTGGSSAWLDTLAESAAVGAILGLMHSLVMSRLGAELRRLVAHVELLARPDAKSQNFQAGMGLQDLANAAAQTVAALRGRVEQLVTQRRELEVQARIAEAERRHAEAILNSISDAVIVTDAFNEVALANEAAARVLDFELDMALRRPVDRVIGDPTLVKLIKDTREGGDTAQRRHVEHRLGRVGAEASYDVTLACVTGRESLHSPPETAGVVTILHDITREKEVAEMKSDFVSSVSHELRTPLSSIKAYMEMLVDGEANDDQTRLEFYNIIQGETNRLQRLIDNILNISRIESGVVKVQREHVSLPQVIREVLDVMQPQARAKSIELAEVPSPLYFQVFADKDMIYQAILNLVGNAIKYTPQGGKVSVALTVDDHHRMVSLSVADTGVGVPRDDLPHLFGKFYRVAEHKKLAMGTGLGLNLVKHIIETVHGGKVGVASQVGQGSTFYFRLPLADNPF